MLRTPAQTRLGFTGSGSAWQAYVCAIRERDEALKALIRVSRIGTHPNRIADYIADVARWNQHAAAHLTAKA